MKIYTLTGDDGTTSLSGGRRVPKHSLRVEAYGSVDEFISWTGLLRDCLEDRKTTDFLLYLQSQLMVCAAVLATDPEKPGPKTYAPDADCISKIEQEIDEMEKCLKPLKNFILPGGHIHVSYCHIARCVCRRAERAVLRLNETEKTSEIVYKILNRMSDYLFVLARYVSQNLGIQEIKWSV